MIRVEGLFKQYGDVRALDGISFEVQDGEVLGFLGPNGAGKTTTMRVLTGYTPPTSGQVTVNGLDALTDSLAIRRNIGYMPETVPLYAEMPVARYLGFMASIRGVQDRDAAVERVMSACDIAHVQDRLIGKLSKGYRQRVGLAQALVHDPQILVLDEPTIGLDPRQILGVRELIRSLGGEHTVILSSHILPEISQVCDRVMIMNRGRIVAEDTTEHLTTRVDRGMRIRMELAQPTSDVRGRIAGLDGVRDVQAAGEGAFEVVSDAESDVRPALAALAVGAGWGLLELRALSLSLEEVFLQLTTEEPIAQDEALAAAGAGRTASDAQGEP